MVLLLKLAHNAASNYVNIKGKEYLLMTVISCTIVYQHTGIQNHMLQLGFSQPTIPQPPPLQQSDNF